MDTPYVALCCGNTVKRIFLDEKRSPGQKPSQHSTLFLDFEIFAKCCDGLDATKGLSFLHSEGRTDGWVVEGLTKPGGQLLGMTL